MLSLEDKQEEMRQKWEGVKTYETHNPVIYAVYVMRAGDFAKIGYSNNVLKRLSSLRSSCPLDLTLLKVYKAPDISGAARLEHALHLACDQYRHRNEWFMFSQPFLDVCETTVNGFSFERVSTPATPAKPKPKPRKVLSPTAQRRSLEQFRTDLYARQDYWNRLPKADKIKQLLKDATSKDPLIRDFKLKQLEELGYKVT
jgi:hypothetical protein